MNDLPTPKGTAEVRRRTKNTLKNIAKTHPALLYDTAQTLLDNFFVTSYYSLQMPNGNYFVARDKERSTDLQIDIPTVHSSLLGQFTIGVYTTNRSNFSKWLCFDFDNPLIVLVPDKAPIYLSNMQDEIKVLTQRLDNLNLQYSIESSGNKGYHVWVLFDKIPTEIAYSLGQHLGNDLTAEVFPKQPSLSGAQYGNLVRLPLNINRKSGMISQFVDTDFAPIPNQYEHVTTLTANIYHTDMFDIPTIPKLNQHSAKYKQITASKAEQEWLKEIAEIVDPTNTELEKGNRHFATFRFVLNCSTLKWHPDKIYEMGIFWLHKNRNRFSSPMYLAIEELKNAIGEVYVTCEQQGDYADEKCS